MTLTIFKSILYGDLRPWLCTSVNEKFYRQNLSSSFIKPSYTIDEYYKALQELLNNNPNLFKEDGLEVYLIQKETEVSHNIMYPLIETSLVEPITSTQKFYHFLLKNEATRLTNRIFKCINTDISDLQKRELIQNVIKSCKNLLHCIGRDRETVPQNELTTYVVPQLISNTIRLLKETEKLYPHYLSDLPSTKNELFGELLQQEIPEIDIEKSTPEFQTTYNILLGIDNYMFEKDTRFSFGFKRDKEKLKLVLNALHRNIELLNEDKTSIEDLCNVLISKDLKRGAAKIYLACETLEFAYIIKKLELSFSNFNPTSIDSSNLFFSKKGIEIKKGSLYNANQREPYKKQEIDKIFNQL